MPETDVRAEFYRGGDVAARFGVSGEAMAWRLYSFGLASAPRPNVTTTKTNRVLECEANGSPARLVPLADEVGGGE
jgi:hypothetical protein